MEPNKNNIILIQENQSKLENTISCERCKNTLSTIFCDECKPFHYFCDQCDTSVHNLISRRNHHRENLSSMDYYSNQNTNNKNSIKNDINNTQYEPENQFYTNKTQSNSYIYNKNNNLIRTSIDDSKKVYSKDYINELNYLHEKEKADLVHKMNILQNTLNRVKSSLNDEISKIKFTQLTTEKEYNDKIDKIKYEYDIKISNLEKEKNFKNKEIENLNIIISEQKKLNEELATSLEQLKYNYDNLNNDHTLLNKEYNLYQKNSKRDYESISNKLNNTLESFNKYKEKR